MKSGKKWKTVDKGAKSEAKEEEKEAKEKKGQVCVPRGL